MPKAFEHYYYSSGCGTDLVAKNNGFPAEETSNAK